MSESVGASNINEPVTRGLSLLVLLAGIAVNACSANPTPVDGGDGDGSAAMDAMVVDGNASSDGAMTSPDGAVIGPDGETILPDGSVVLPDVSTDVSSDVSSGPCVPRACAGGGGVAQCADCIDNDGDGLVDERDPECLGPCDNTEGPVLLTGVPGESGGRCRVDCYFDAGNGSGSDQCRWDHRCDPLSVAPDFPPEGPTCPYDRNMVGGMTCPNTQPARCVETCRPITPNGCDCFGCCTFPAIRGRPAAMGGEYVWLGSRDAMGNGSCTLAAATDTSRCKPCTPVPSCFNDCGPCEVCIGRPMPPPECFPPPAGDGGVWDGSRPDSSIPTTDGGTPATQCPAGIQPCGLPGQSPCPSNFYCTTGCCIPIPL
jgi:hypothetical protein